MGEQRVFVINVPTLSIDDITKNLWFTFKIETMLCPLSTDSFFLLFLIEIHKNLYQAGFIHFLRTTKTAQIHLTFQK